MSTVVGEVLVDGRPVAPEEACISVFDVGFQRGYGCFESMRSYGGTVFRMADHLDRLATSAAALAVPLPDRPSLEAWCAAVADAAGDASVRVFVTGGRDATRPGTGSQVVVFAEVPEEIPTEVRLGSRLASWHPDGTPSELTGAKVLSYAPNLAATLAARRDGYDDALLVGRSGTVLEGPTFSVAWFRGDVLVTPDLELGILASITRAAVLELARRDGTEIDEGRFELGDLLAADEVLAMSTVKEVVPVVDVDGIPFPRGARTGRLRRRFEELVREETGR